MSSHYDPAKHHRRSIRLRGYDYACPGAYFVTIVTRNRECLFSEPVFRRIAEYNWRQITRHFENVILGEWVVMPNHIHGIIVITEDVSAGHDARTGEAFARTSLQVAQDRLVPTKISGNQQMANASPLPVRGVQSGVLGAIVGNFKSVTTRRINTIRKTRGATIWHRNYYEHIVRNERDLNRICKYIVENPEQWESDRENRKTSTENDSWLAHEKNWFATSNLKSSHA